MMVSGIYYILRTGQPWRDLPTEFGSWASVYTRFRRWSRSGLRSQMLTLLTAEACGMMRSVDCTHIKVHQDASNAAGGAGAQAIGKTKGGSNTKLAVIVDGLGRAVGLNLVAGNRHDLRAVEPLMEQFSGCMAIADRGFDAKSFRGKLLRCDATSAKLAAETLYTDAALTGRQHRWCNAPRTRGRSERLATRPQAWV